MQPKSPPRNPRFPAVSHLLARWNSPAFRLVLRRLEQSRAVAISLVFGLTLLVLASLGGLGGGLPLFPYTKSVAPSPVAAVPAERIEDVINVAGWPRMTAMEKEKNPFFTLHFQPPPPPPPAKPPTTKKVDLVYQGFFETSVGERHAFVKVDDGLVVGPAGSKVVADLYVKEMDLRTLTMTNQSAQTNLLEFNAKKTIEVPMP